MRVQRVLMPGSSREESWTVLGDDHVPLDVPVGPDPLADAVVDAAVGLVRQALGGVVVADLAA